VPLSEEELRLLEQMERALVADDPKLASTMRGTTLRASARRRALIAALAFVVGVVGFVVMLVSAYVALSSWRGQHRTPEPTRTTEPGAHPSFSVIDGGRSSRKRSLRGSRSSSSHGSMMERFEERWRRRRDQNGF
jgi:ferric-dicitrate binding protein FerR (iron transport regulator)